MMNLTQRAAIALDNARDIEPDYATQPVPARFRVYRSQLVNNLATVLGVDPALITIHDDPDRARFGIYYAQRLAVIGAGAAYEFAPVVGWETVPLFHLLGRCPGCGGLVPVATIATLADLGYYLATGLPPYQDTDEHRWDPDHGPDCTEAVR